jgi:N-6 DNA Methylase
MLRPVDYKHLGAEELGSVYESLLELHPELYVDTPTFALDTASGNQRQTTGSYHTPTSLVQCLLDSALDPVLDEAARQSNAEEAILALKVCDPACGSGHFLIAAAHRIAKRLAAIRTGDDEPSPEATRSALRAIISHCIYGVDVNPMAVELCKVSLWLEAIEPGKPLAFLEHHIQCGNSLLGTTPALLARGIPDAAFEPIAGDEKSVVSTLRRRNKTEWQGLTSFSFIAAAGVAYGSLNESMSTLNAIADTSIAEVHCKEQG